MTNELAKQLKDAGFPQEGRLRGKGIYDYDKEVYIPTLSEIIEACGVGFDSLRKEEFTNSWKAEMYWSTSELDTDWYVAPEEAVAKLWLALHAKEESKNWIRELVNDDTITVDVPTPSGWDCSRRACNIDYKHIHSNFDGSKG